MILLEVIKQNPFKVVYIFMLALSYYGIHSGEMVDKKHPVVSSTHVNGKYIHILADGETRETDDPLVDKDIYTFSEADGYIVMGILGLILFGLLLFFGTVIPDEDMNWNFWDCRYANLKNQVELSKEGNTYHYFLKGKLLISSDHSLHPREIPIRPYMSNKKILEDYIPTNKKRKIILKDLLNI